MPKRQPLVAALLLPLVALVLFAGYVLFDKLGTYREAARVARVIALAKAASPLVHELQRERGLTALYLGGGSGRDEVAAQWAGTDARVATLREALAAAALASAAERRDVLAVQAHLDSLQAHRKAVAEGAIDERLAVQAYTRIVGALQAGIGRVRASGPLTSALTAFGAVGRLKEEMGRERSAGAAGFAHGRFGHDLYRQMTETRARQAAYLETFETHGEAEDLRALRQALTADLTRRLDGMRSLAAQSYLAGAPAAADARQWFDLLSTAIDALGETEIRLAARIDERLGELMGGARMALWGGVAGTLLLVLLSAATLLRGEWRLRRAHAALRVEADNTRHIIEAMRDGICVIDAAGTVVYANPALKERFGANPVGLDCRDYLTEDLAQCRTCTWRTTGAYSTGPDCWEHAGRNYEITSTYIVAASGERRLLKVFHDVTALREAHRNSELANRAKTEFLANMSHELRTPLNAIIGFSDIMRAEIMGPIGNSIYDGYVEDINQAGKHLLALVNDILDVSRIEAGTIKLSEDVVEMAEIIDAALRLVTARAVAGGITIAADVAPGLPGLAADGLRIKQVLVNLLSNAVKFTPAGGRVRVVARLSAEGGIECAVEDTGIGMAPEEVPRVLKPFEQVDSRLARRFEGSGLGLSLAQNLIALHGGTLAIATAPGAGTTVVLRFPPERCVRRQPTSPGALSENPA